MDKTKTVKTGITLPVEILEIIDEYMKKHKVKSRSRLLAEAVRSFIMERIWVEKHKVVMGVIIIVYNEKKGETVKKLLDVQHDYLDEIISTTHFHLSHERCLEVIMVRGESANIMRLITKMENISGIELTKFIPVEVKNQKI